MVRIWFLQNFSPILFEVGISIVKRLGEFQFSGFLVKEKSRVHQKRQAEKNTEHLFMEQNSDVDSGPVACQFQRIFIRPQLWLFHVSHGPGIH